MGRDWSRIETVFGAALELTGEARSEYLARVCGSDIELRREVEALLAEDEASGVFLDAPLMSPGLGGESAVADAPSHGEPDPALGREVGSYRLVEWLGQGGMGVVYRAERVDGAFEQQVAVKLLRGAFSPSAVRRFEAERQILAGLDHPYIARLLDGGATAEGQPYVVMECVEGLPIDAWCEAGGRKVGERVDLMIRVCEAVSAAHRRLIVHRDLKPSNILVTEDGTPKLLDFGIAKALDPEGVGVEGATTHSWHRLLTPGYAAPEQLRGEGVTVATDVYLLGIVLYRLLSGRLPHDVAGRSLQEAEKLLRQTPPSAGVHGELEAILERALRPEPERRYPSVEQFADDLRRHREGLPVRALAGRKRYRAGKFLRRRWLPLTVTGIVIALSVAFGIYQQRQAEALRQALAQAHAVENVLVGVLLTAEPGGSTGEEETPVLTREIRRWADSLDRDLSGHRQAEVRVRGVFGRLFLKRDQLDDAQEQLKTALQLARDLPERESDLRSAILRSESDLAMVAFQRATEMPEAEAAQERARSVLEQARRSLPGDDPALLAMLSNLASIYCWLGKIDRAAPLSAEILALARQRGSRADLTVAAALAQQALVYKNQAGDLDTAADLYRQALEIHRRLTGELHPDVANTHNQLGLIAREQGDLAEAVTQHTTALDIRRRLYPEGDHWEIAQSHGHLGAVRRDQGEFAAAIEHLRQAHLMYLEHPDRGVEHTRTGEYLIQVGEVFLLWGDPQAAERTVRREIPTAWWDARPENSRMVAWANGVLGQALALQGREAEARPLLEGAAKALAEKPQGYERENRQVQTWYAALDF